MPDPASASKDPRSAPGHAAGGESEGKPRASAGHPGTPCARASPLPLPAAASAAAPAAAATPWAEGKGPLARAEPGAAAGAG